MPSNTLLLIQNEFVTVFELGIQRLETLEQLLEIQLFAGTCEAGARNNFA